MKKRSHIQKLIEPTGFNEGDTWNRSGDGIWERIAERAYEMYEQRGREDGRDVEDWLHAEAIVTSQISGHQ
ncbi:MAG TPA: DUF2934 domain-containing protein [Nitrospiraceae bacterium]|nr:DUF2934 domain-containing protein [Nitrospiraceae bacterium]